MQTMTPWARLVMLSLALSALAGCAVSPLPVERLGTREAYLHDRNNLFCVGHLDRTSLAARVGRSSIDQNREIVVGYDNILYRGAEPTPCHTSHSTLYTGRARFLLSRDLVSRLDRAGGVVHARLILQRRSSGIPIVAGDSGDVTPRGNDRCRFGVFAADEDWRPGYERDGQQISFGQSTEILSGPMRPVLVTFVNRDGGPAEFQLASPALTRVVQDWASGARPNFGVLIRPTDDNPAVFRGLSNATCTGILRDPQLELFVPRRF